MRVNWEHNKILKILGLGICFIYLILLPLFGFFVIYVLSHIHYSFTAEYSGAFPQAIVILPILVWLSLIIGSTGYVFALLHVTFSILRFKNLDKVDRLLLIGTSLFVVIGTILILVAVSWYNPVPRVQPI